MLRESDRSIEFEFAQLEEGFTDCIELIDSLKPDIVILHLHLKLPFYWLIVHWIRFRSIPLISWTKGVNLDRAASRLRFEIFNYTHCLSDAIVMYSSNEARYIKPGYRGKVFIANNTVNFEEYPAISQRRAEIKAELEISFDKIVLFVGTMGVNGERKRVRQLIDLFCAIERKDVGLFLVGAGMSQNDILAINPDNTRILGAIHDVGDRTISKLFKAADIFVVPGHVGLGINQAFYWGLPVITGSCDQPPEIHYLKSGYNGYIVPGSDLDWLKARIFEVLEDDELLDRLSSNARNDIYLHASIESMFQSFFRAVQFVHRSPDTSGIESETKSRAA